MQSKGARLEILWRGEEVDLPIFFFIVARLLVASYNKYDEYIKCNTNIVTINDAVTNVTTMESITNIMMAPGS